MSVRRWLASLSVLSLVVGCGGGSGNNNGGGNNPSLTISPASSTVIAGGSPVNFTATLANATGSVSWALSGPGSINPTTGDATSYTPPASVTSSTTATLTATAAGLTASATITVDPPPTITVAGTVKDLTRKGIAAATVAIGSQHTTTDGTGGFTIAGVTAPYDATVIVPVGSRNAAIVFKGLTRVDPTLFALPVAGTLPSAGTVTGSVSGGDPLPAASDITAVSWGSPETTQTNTFATNPWSLNLSWAATPAATTGNVHALQWTPASGIPTGYRGHGVKTGVAVANGGTTSSVAVAMSAPASSTIGGTVTVPAGVTMTGKALSIDFADGASFSVGSENSAATAFNYPVPTGIDSTASVLAGGTATGAITLTRVRGIAAGSTGTTVSVLAPATQSTPVNNATGVSTSTDFTWTQLTGGLHFVVITSASATAPVYYLITTGTTGRIPDLSALGVVLPGATAYSWAILAVGPWASVDDFAGGTGLLPTGANTLSQSLAAGRAFTTQ
ncbi:MAG TPA: hypothetical protein VFD38_02385 [Myxococcaceae bacterium]|nr:hypothetical protein [Myxococcaceae bacterium]